MMRRSSLCALAAMLLVSTSGFAAGIFVPTNFCSNTATCAQELGQGIASSGFDGTGLGLSFNRSIIDSATLMNVQTSYDFMFQTFQVADLTFERRGSRLNNRNDDADPDYRGIWHGQLANNQIPNAIGADATGSNTEQDAINGAWIGEAGNGHYAVSGSLGLTEDTTTSGGTKTGAKSTAYELYATYGAGVGDSLAWGVAVGYTSVNNEFGANLDSEGEATNWLVKGGVKLGRGSDFQHGYQLLVAGPSAESTPGASTPTLKLEGLTIEARGQWNWYRGMSRDFAIDTRIGNTEWDPTNITGNTADVLTSDSISNTWWLNDFRWAENVGRVRIVKGVKLNYLMNESETQFQGQTSAGMWEQNILQVVPSATAIFPFTERLSGHATAGWFYNDTEEKFTAPNSTAEVKDNDVHNETFLSLGLTAEWEQFLFDVVWINQSSVGTKPSTSSDFTPFDTRQGLDASSIQFSATVRFN